MERMLKTDWKLSALLVAILMVLSLVSAQAQDAAEKIELVGAWDQIAVGSSPAELTVEQLETLPESTLLYFCLKPADVKYAQGMYRYTIWDHSYLLVPGSATHYRLLSTINMPISTEGEQHWLQSSERGMEHHFALEFERLPDNATDFDFIDSQQPSVRVSGIRPDYTHRAQPLDLNRLAANNPVHELSHYWDQGSHVYCMEWKDVRVLMQGYINEDYGDWFRINVQYENRSSRPILVSTDNISCEGYMKHEVKDRDPETLSYDVHTEYDEIPRSLDVVSLSEYSAKVSRRQAWAGFAMGFASGLQAAAAQASAYDVSSTSYSGGGSSYGSAYGPGGMVLGSSYNTTYGSSTTRTYNSAAAYAAQQRIADNLAGFQNQQCRIYNKIQDDYIKTHTLRPGESYCGYFNIPYDKHVGILQITFTIDGERYTHVLNN